MTLVDCIIAGAHLSDCDDDGFCNECGFDDNPVLWNEDACNGAWKIAVSQGEWAALMAATLVVEAWLTERQVPLGIVNPVETAIAALALTPAELQSFDRWCPGHGDEEDCEVDPTNPCRACYHAGHAQETSR